MFLELLKPYVTQAEEDLKNISFLFQGDGKLQKACLYALFSGGKRIRPALVYMVAEALGKGGGEHCGALAIECFHTASLIADDLPCMDNDDFRRGKPTVHKVFGEQIALLSTYCLISAGYESLERGFSFLEKFSDKDRRLHELIRCATKNTGIEGACSGQLLDLEAKGDLLEILRKKTATFFEMSFVFGWLFGGGDLDNLPKVKELAASFGLAFQMGDDLSDREEDLKKGRVNLAVTLGKEVVEQMFHVETNRFFSIFRELFGADWCLEKKLFFQAQLQ